MKKLFVVAFLLLAACPNWQPSSSQQAITPAQNPLVFSVKLGFTGCNSGVGAAGNGTTNDAPAFQCAFDAAKAAGGGVVYIPAGDYRLASQISISANYSSPVPTPNGQYQRINVRGEGSASNLIMDANGLGTGGVFNIYGFMMTFEDFVVNPLNTDNDGTNDVGHSVILLQSCMESHIRNVWFNGVRAGAAIVYNTDSDMDVEYSQFTGTSAAASGNLGVVAAYQFSKMRLFRNRFEEQRYCRGQIINKLASESNAPWVYMTTPGNSVAVDYYNGVNNNTIEISRNVFIGGVGTSPTQMIMLDGPTSGATVAYDRVWIADNNIDVPAYSGTKGVEIHNARYVQIDRTLFGWGAESTHQAIDLHSVDTCVINGSRLMTGYNQDSPPTWGPYGPTDITVDANLKHLLINDTSYGTIHYPGTIPSTLHAREFKGGIVVSGSSVN